MPAKDDKNDISFFSSVAILLQVYVHTDLFVRQSVRQATKGINVYPYRNVNFSSTAYARGLILCEDLSDE